VAEDLLHVHLGAAAARIAEVTPVERDHVHARFLPNPRARGQRNCGTRALW
jgi:hypothetical protein